LVPAFNILEILTNSPYTLKICKFQEYEERVYKNIASPNPLKMKSRSFPPVFGNIYISVYIHVESGMANMYTHFYMVFLQ